MDELIPNENYKILFGNTIKSDGFSVDFVFYRKERMNNGSDVELTLEDFNYEEVHNQYHPMFLVPGRSTVYGRKLELKKSALASKRSSLKFPHHKQQQLDHTINMLNTC
ncbi:hypothetical protein G6F46_012891 [Rhizopus delemar]|uniref:Uncharacterized protein n=2 Tax=Rhizopus TaxID=4842 RepID=A0A9P6YQ21_9FUNG|nr:hypothetical protein G6F55_013329 [Rhizopus delemar]KAG1532335.1 hypothetical protein G6F51_013155 [Rhizopus arrhizus]KAG1487061.1 hypothetical protein G6F54_012898 [Rhizopus delemar]KAG1489904.1 hypothetical protein G6F53_013339 [Rhizopus delemar]KAG1536375.1 hypothetical protein G6F49_012992 [Rhizopus delemar]